MKKMLDAMKDSAVKEINAAPLDLIGLEVGSTTDKDTGEVKHFVRVDVEVRKGSGHYSRCQFSVKIPDTSDLKVSAAELEEADYLVFFRDLEISFIDDHGNVYFRAAGYEVEREEVDD